MAEYTIKDINARIPIGSITSFLGSYDPVGWVICDGQARNYTTRYDTLISAGFGFKLNNTYVPPDYRGLFQRGSNKGTSANVAGSGYGSYSNEIKTVRPHSITSHNHIATNTSESQYLGGTSQHVHSTQLDSMGNHQHEMYGFANRGPSDVVVRGGIYNTNNATKPDATTGSGANGYHNHAISSNSTSVSDDHTHNIGNVLTSNIQSRFKNHFFHSGSVEVKPGCICINWIIKY